jgi:protein gp37
MYFLDAQREKDGGEIYKVKTNFNLPLKKNRQGEYKIPSGSTIRVCMTSDFFLEEADEWRNDVWDMIRIRKDVTFWIQTKRAERVPSNLPKDWGDGWENVIMVFTAESQKRADERIPILLDLPIKRKGIMCAPMIEKITLDKYLQTGQIEIVLVDGENYDGYRPLHYEWVKLLYDECIKYNVKFDFVGTGNVFIKDGKTYHVFKAYQRVMALRSKLQNPIEYEEIKVQPKCRNCKRRESCSGCSWCGKCNR